MTKKILAMLLAIALTVALAAPAISTTAKAAATEHCICGADNRVNGVHTEDCYLVPDNVWTEVSDLAGLTAAVTSANSGETVYVKLTAGIKLNARLTPTAGKMTIDLNGNDITTTLSSDVMLNPKGTAEVVLTDRSANADGTISHTGTSTSWGGGLMRLEGTAKMYIFGGEYDASGLSVGYGGVIRVNTADNNLYMHGGVMRGGTTTGSGGSAVSCAGKFYMTGGTIYGGTHTGTATFGGGAIATNKGKLYISGNAQIIGGKTTTGLGGAIYMRDSYLEISGNALIDGTNSSTKSDGGVIYAENNTATSQIVIKGGEIKGGTAPRGGAIALKSGSVTMSRGTIYAGNATDNGGAIALLTTAAKFTMNGGTIDASGKTAGHGVAIGSNNAEVVINDGLIIGGTSTGSGGAAISSFTSGNKFTMNGGTITGGIHNGSNIVGRGGAVRVSSGTLVMTGGTITGGTNKVGVGGGLMVAGTSPATISGNVVITGNTDKDGNASNLYLDGTNKITFGEGGLGKDANIGITMTTPGTFITADAEEADLAYFSSDADGYYVAQDGNGLKLTNEIGNNTAAIGSALYLTINDAIAAITDRNSQSVKLVQDTNEAVTVDGDLYLDLNGKTLDGNNVTVSGGTLKLFDSKTADYDVSDGIYGKITGDVNGNIARSFVNPDNQRYLVIKTNEGYSAHRIYLAVTHSVLDSNYFSAMNYKTVFMCDEVIAKLVSDYGVTVKAEMEGSYSYFPNSSVAIDAWDGMKNNEKTTEIENFLIAGDAENEKRAETLIEVNAYITLKDQLAGNITSAKKTRSLKQMIEGALSMWDTQLTVSQKKTMKQMYNTYNQGGFMDRWSGIEKVQQFDITSKNSIASVGYAAVKIDPIEGMFDGQENAVGLLGMGDENTRLVQAVDPNAPLMAICLAVTDQDGNTVLLISVDAAGISDTAAQQVVTGITALGYGVKEGNIMIASNHQHSTPNFTAAYRNYFVSQVVEGARLALEDRKEVIGMTAQIVEVGENTFNFVRNVQYTDASGKPIPSAMLTDNHNDANRGISYSGKIYESTADDDVQLVKITRVGDEQPIILANFQTHPHLSVDSNNKKSVAYHTATADIIGVFRNQLAKELNCKPMYFTGSSGNINAWSYIDTSKEKADFYYITQGQKLANVVANGIQDSAWVSVVSESTGGVAVKTVTRKYGVMLNSVPSWLSGKTMDKIVDRAAKIWDGSNYGTWTNDDLTSFGIYSKYHAKYIVMRSTNKATDTKEITISAIAIGDMAFVVAPYEMYDTNGMQIKTGSPFKVTFTTQQADMPTSSRVRMSNGYIPSALSYANGGYSVDIAQFAAGTGEKLAQDYIYILNELHQ